MFKGVLIHWMCLGEKLEKWEREFSQNYQEDFFFGGGGGKMGGLGAFILEKFPFSFQRPLTTLLTSTILAFSRFTLDVYLKAFLDLDWVDLSVLGKLWMSSFQKTKEIENPTVGSKLWPREPYWCTFHGFLYISTVLIPILINE